MKNPTLWLLLVHAVLGVGCGDDGAAAMPDASGADGPIDIAQCGGGGPVTVVGPVSETVAMTVVSHDPNGAFCSKLGGGTGSEARLTIDVPPSGMVTAIVDSGQDRRLFTWTEVKAGDELVYPSTSREFAGLTGKTVSISVDVPALSGATSYDVYLQCEHAGGDSKYEQPAGMLTTSMQCWSNATTVAAMVAAKIGDTTQYALAPVTPIAASGATTITLGAWAPAANPTVTVHGALGFERANVQYWPGPSLAFESELFGAWDYTTTDATTLPAVPVPTAWPHEFAIELYKLETAGNQFLRMYLPQTTAMSRDLSVASDFMPLLTASLDTGVPRPKMTWAPQRAATGDAVYLNAGGWLMIARAQPGTIRFPEVPAQLLPKVPSRLAAVSLIDVEGVGFDDLRRDPISAYIGHNYNLSNVGMPFEGVVP